MKKKTKQMITSIILAVILAFLLNLIGMSLVFDSIPFVRTCLLIGSFCLMYGNIIFYIIGAIIGWFAGKKLI